MVAHRGRRGLCDWGYGAHLAASQYSRCPELTAHVSDIVGSVQLYEESIGITELEGFLRSAGLQRQTTRLQFGRRLLCVKAGDSEVVMIEGGPTVLLFDSEETLPYPKMCVVSECCFSGIPNNS